jgi:hypothetical protein
VFENGKEYLFKHFRLTVPSYSERAEEDWNLIAHGKMQIDRETSTAVIYWDENE